MRAFDERRSRYPVSVGLTTTSQAVSIRARRWIVPASTVPLSDALVPLVAAALGGTYERAAFQVAGAAVYHVHLTPSGKPGVRITLWPSLARADAAAGDCVVIFKGIDNVRVFAGQEVIFQRGERQGFLLISCDGRIATAS
jgi:hypothetical protein